MRVAAQVGFDGPDSIEVQERPDPEPDEGEAVVDVAAAATNHHDLWFMYAPSRLVGEDDLPFVPGLDCAGTVREAPDDASVEPGDRVVLCPNQTCGTCEFCREGPENLCERFSLFHGAFAEQVAVPADRLVPLPEGVDLGHAAALPTAYMTAYHMIKKAGTEPGDLVVVPGATGGVGVAAIQLLDAMGARSVGTSTSARKLAELEALGVDHTVQSADVDEIAAELQDLGRADAMLNHLGGEYTSLGVKAVKRGCPVVICGRTAGGVSEIDVQRLFLSHKEVIGSTMGTQGDLAAIVQLVADGHFEPAIGEEYALDETDRAFHDMEDRDAFGQQLIRP
ncbi:MAG: alcohol dehydrogenase catalytic domain-containing protein [Haloarculaceae archaeon]